MKIDNLYIKVGPKSFKKGNFFHTLHEENIFNKVEFDTLKNDITEAIKLTSDYKTIDKIVIKHLYVMMGIFYGVHINMNYNGLNVNGVADTDELFSYYEELEELIIELLS